MTQSRFLLAMLVLVLAAPSRGTTQEPIDPDAMPLSCEPGAVSVDISRAPGVRFVPADRPEPMYPDPREFRFTAGPIRQVRLFLWATLPEGGVGRGSEAALHVVAQTSASADPTVPMQWWRLTPAPIEPFSGDDRAAQTLRFDAKDLAPCFNGEPCRFAEVTPAADEATALLVLSFTRDLGGANADNWEHARLVLDFRGAEPRVAVAVTCGYNEGGGACTAFDSGTMARSDLSCPWDRAAGDFACTEASDQSGHRDFHLLSGQPGPGRGGEVPTLEAAARELARGATGPVVVTGLSPVRLVHEAALGSARVLVFAAGGQFHLAERTADGIGPLTPVAPRGLAADPAVEPPSLPDPGWTSDRDPVLDAAEIARAGSSIVLRIVERVEFGSAAPAQPHTLFWLGVERTNGRLRADLLTLVSPGGYAGCGRTAVPTVVTAIRRVARPFEATIDVQPPTITDLEGEVIWHAADLGEDVRECRRPGRIRWRDGRFDVAIDDRDCRAAERPVSVDLTADGAIRLSPTVREP
jgi:hypothetical protein